MKKATRGRPLKPMAKKRTEHITLKVTRAERNMLAREASKRDISVSALLMVPWRKGKV